MDPYATQLGDWLDSFGRWDYWMTVTSREPWSVPAWRRNFARYWNAQKDTSAPDRIFWGTEEGKKLGRTHVHALVWWNPERDDLLHRGAPASHVLWDSLFRKFGRTHVDRFEQGKGAAHYVGKYVSKQLADYDMWTTGDYR